MQKIIITAPSLEPTRNVSGVSSVVSFIIENNRKCEYLHFQLGKTDGEKGGWHRIGIIVSALRTWKRMLDEHSDAIVHYSFPLSAPSILRDPLFMCEVLKRGMKMIVHVHGGQFLTAPKTPFVLWKILLMVFSWKVPFIVLSEREKRILQNRFGARNVQILPNCVELNDAKKFERKIGEAPLILGYLGRIESNKGMTELLGACIKLKKEGIPFKLVLAGKEKIADEYLPHFAQWLGDDFHYVGIVSGKMKADFLKSVDVFVMPTYFEGLPMSLLECMSYGCVPVVTNVGSIGDVVMSYNSRNVSEEANGIFVMIRDEDSIVDAVNLLHKDRVLVQRLSEAAKRYIFCQFSSERYIKALNDIYANC
ncbi:glycosyltransferase family 4 protein [Bacteroides ovatus]|uniref:glycosyltransferase family 4 protein n=1 Tax=Bacteroides ovatus TaxID=28116 RepID=UPI001896AF8A|nr:glycosyltransferase family 4 protein [Bacteroides ovatus]MDC2622719.1 glycosyltransferase family 4 protein [Bacteroides ovatus]MDC2636555.1 glycosyltransferase family 4 protein [Bacteroides ovatus]